MSSFTVCEPRVVSIDFPRRQYMSVQRAPVPLPSQSSAPHAESEWQRGRCGMRVFVYTSYIEHLAHQLETGRLFGFPLRNESIHGTSRTGSNGKDAHGDAVARLLPSRRRSCLEDACNYSTFTSDPVSKFGWSIRQYTARCPSMSIITECPSQQILNRLIYSLCPSTSAS